MIKIKITELPKKQRSNFALGGIINNDNPIPNFANNPHQEVPVVRYDEGGNINVLPEVIVTGKRKKPSLEDIIALQSQVPSSIPVQQEEINIPSYIDIINNQKINNIIQQQQEQELQNILLNTYKYQNMATDVCSQNTEQQVQNLQKKARDLELVKQLQSRVFNQGGNLFVGGGKKYKHTTTYKNSSTRGHKLSIKNNKVYIDGKPAPKGYKWFDKGNNRTYRVKEDGTYQIIEYKGQPVKPRGFVGRDISTDGADKRIFEYENKSAYDKHYPYDDQNYKTAQAIKKREGIENSYAIPVGLPNVRDIKITTGNRFKGVEVGTNVIDSLVQNSKNKQELIQLLGLTGETSLGKHVPMTVTDNSGKWGENYDYNSLTKSPFYSRVDNTGLSYLYPTDIMNNHHYFITPESNANAELGRRGLGVNISKEAFLPKYIHEGDLSEDKIKQGLEALKYTPKDTYSDQPYINSLQYLNTANYGMGKAYKNNATLLGTELYNDPAIKQEIINYQNSKKSRAQGGNLFAGTETPTQQMNSQSLRIASMPFYIDNNGYFYYDDDKGQLVPSLETVMHYNPNYKSGDSVAGLANYFVDRNNLRQVPLGTQYYQQSDGAIRFEPTIEVNDTEGMKTSANDKPLELVSPEFTALTAGRALANGAIDAMAEPVYNWTLRNPTTTKLIGAGMEAPMYSELIQRRLIDGDNSGGFVQNLMDATVGLGALSRIPTIANNAYDLTKQGWNWANRNYVQPYRLSRSINQGVSENGIITGYNRNPRNLDTGSIWDYQNYLDKVFPNSKVQDIQYHVGPKGIEKLKPNINNGESYASGNWNTNPDAKGIYISPDLEYPEFIRKFTTDRIEHPSFMEYVRRNVFNDWDAFNSKYTDIYPVKVNIQKPLYTRGTWTWGMPQEKYNNIMSEYDGIINNGTYPWQRSYRMRETIIPESNQTLILGSNEDAVGFNNYMNTARTAQEQPTNLLLDNNNGVVNSSLGNNINSGSISTTEPFASFLNQDIVDNLYNVESLQGLKDLNMSDYQFQSIFGESKQDIIDRALKAADNVEKATMRTSKDWSNSKFTLGIDANSKEEWIDKFIENTIQDRATRAQDGIDAMNILKNRQNISQQYLEWVRKGRKGEAPPFVKNYIEHEAFLNSPQYKQQLIDYYINNGGSPSVAEQFAEDEIGKQLYRIQTAKVGIYPDNALLSNDNGIVNIEKGPVNGFYNPTDHSIAVKQSKADTTTPVHEEIHASDFGKPYLDNKNYAMSVKEGIEHPEYYKDIVEQRPRVLAVQKYLMNKGIDYRTASDKEILDALLDVPRDELPQDIQSLLDNYKEETISNTVRNFKSIIVPAAITTGIGLSAASNQQALGGNLLIKSTNTNNLFLN